MGVLRLLVGLSLTALALEVQAQNATFQDFMFRVCPTTQGALADRAAETPGGNCDISGDSESSLNPSQALAGNDRLLSRVQDKNEDVQARMEELRDEGVDTTLDGATYSFFVNGRGNIFDRDETDLERGFDGDTLTLELGVDRRLSASTVIGGLVAFETTDVNFDADQPGVNFTPPDNDGSTEADSITLVVFTSHDLPREVFVEGSAGYGFADYTLRRNAVFQETTRTVPQTNVRTTGDTDGDDYWLSAGIGKQMHGGAADGSVYGRLNYTHATIDGYTEEDPTNSGLQMTFDDNTTKSLTSVLGVRAGFAVSQSWGVMIPQGRAEWVHELENDPQDVDTSFVLDAAGNELLLVGDDPDEDYFNLGLGVVFVLPQGWMPFVDYQGLFGYDDLDRHRFTLGLRKEL